MKKEEKISIETMTGMGKKKELAGREYLILPVNIKDMCYIMGESEDTPKLVIIDKKKMETDDDLSWQLFGLNITNPEIKKVFMYIINKYVYYCVGDEKIPMTEELLIEHNWSFKEIGEFLYTWTQISD
jgi:hypothetical protein